MRKHRLFIVFWLLQFFIFNIFCVTKPLKKDEKNQIEITKGNYAITNKLDEQITDQKGDGKEESPGKKIDKRGSDIKSDDIEQILKINADFLSADDNASEVFRVLISSNHYIVSQMKFGNIIARVKDTGGDEYIIDEIKRLDKINEIREGLISIWLFPDSGSIMKVRPQRPTYIVEVDKLLTDDVQRWNFNFPKKIVQPTKFDIKYRVVLRKTQSDDQIIKEVQKRLRDGQ